METVLFLAWVLIDVITSLLLGSWLTFPANIIHKSYLLVAWSINTYWVYIQVRVMITVTNAMKESSDVSDSYEASFIIN